MNRPPQQLIASVFSRLALAFGQWRRLTAREGGNADVAAAKVGPVPLINPRRLHAGLIMALALALSGCTLWPEPKAIALYQLPDTRVTTGTPGAATWTLRVATPQGSQAMDGRTLLVTRDGSELLTLAGARWVSPAKVLWRDRMAAAFIADGRLAGVTSDADSLRADRELGGTLRAFHGDLRGERPAVLIHYHGQLIDRVSRRILASRDFRVSEPAASAAAADLVAAFAAATDTLALELVNWMLAVDSKE